MWHEKGDPPGHNGHSSSMPPLENAAGGVKGSTTTVAAAAAGSLNSTEMQSIIDEMRTHDFDSIRFATYRAACKLRFIQKKTNVHKVDIWNMIEAFRENGLNALPVHSQVKSSRLELLLTTVFHNLNKRLDSSQQIDTDRSISLLLSFLLGAYDKPQTGRLTVFAIKIALATICAGKLVEKLRYIFSQISDSSGLLHHARFADFLEAALALTTAVFEAPTFGYTEAAPAQCFPKDSSVNVNLFVETFLSEPTPSCLMWLPLLHRMASVEHVYHPVQCDACQARSFTGFRYKCQRCANYQLCQSCFWRGRTSGSHSNEHEMKEYSSYKSPTKQLAHSLHKSLQCLPTASKAASSPFDTRIHSTQRPALDLSNIIPATPNAVRRLHPPDPHPASSHSSPPVFLPGQLSSNGGNGMDDEHRLIARYSAKLSGRAEYPIGSGRSLSERCLDDRTMIARLEEENSEMIREMNRLDSQVAMSEDDHMSLIRERKWQLEEQMFTMQAKRRDLMQQLEMLLPALNSVQSPMNSVAGSSLQLPDLTSRLSSAFRGSSLPATSLQCDLLSAADDITNNMSTLVRQLDTATSEALVNGRASS
ncbi:hypothetical protein PFISCL1PPCAC_20570 [Pristionchus fissidentatus]|uniref:Dystrobrevin n=1 Tax=Pristionchus fissidentatus TaxID=1538716 RepID=A0AAV5WF06_9BILA|nr:hypothetical protein PFISCL1PPCAC_20570 [Pristionchus fissidentatus]